MTLPMPGSRVPTDAPVDVGVITVGGNTEAWAATEGGLQWDPGKKVRHVEYDGRSFEHEGLHRTTGYDAKVSGKVKRGGPALMLDLEPGSESDGSSGSDGNTVSLLAVRTPWEEGMYLSDVNYMVRQQNNIIFVVHMELAYVKSYKLATKDNEEGMWDIDLVPVKSRASAETDPYSVPFTYHYYEAA